MSNLLQAPFNLLVPLMSSTGKSGRCTSGAFRQLWRRKVRLRLGPLSVGGPSQLKLRSLEAARLRSPRDGKVSSSQVSLGHLFGMFSGSVSFGGFRHMCSQPGWGAVNRGHRLIELSFGAPSWTLLASLLPLRSGGMPGRSRMLVILLGSLFLPPLMRRLPFGIPFMPMSLRWSPAFFAPGAGTLLSVG